MLTDTVQRARDESGSAVWGWRGTKVTGRYRTVHQCRFLRLNGSVPSFSWHLTEVYLRQSALHLPAVLLLSVTSDLCNRRITKKQLHYTLLKVWFNPVWISLINYYLFIYCMSTGLIGVLCSITQMHAGAGTDQQLNTPYNCRDDAVLHLNIEHCFLFLR